MAFRTILGKLFLTDQDRQIIDADLRVVERYTEEVLEQERWLEEERRAAEAREAARKAEEERLAAIRKAEEAKLAEAEQEKEKNSSEERFSPMNSSDYDGPRYSLAGPYYDEDVEKPKPKKPTKSTAFWMNPGDTVSISRNRNLLTCLGITALSG